MSKKQTKPQQSAPAEDESQNPAIQAALQTLEQQKAKLEHLKTSGAEPSAIAEQEHRLLDYNAALKLLRTTPESLKTSKKAAPETEIKIFDVTPKGEKKRQGTDIQPSFSPKYVETAWGDWWEAQGFFKPDPKAEGEPFVMVIPPPNVTGTLHLGHALTNSVEDALVRYHRMHGRQTLWVPGVDHAGIATQAVVERKLYAESGLTRHDLGREKFLEHVWKWKDQYGDHICQQLRRLGSSLDWSRNCFTMDDKLSRAVKEAFIRMFNMGLIYRETRLVNWCCKLNTAMSDMEVDPMAVDTPTSLVVPGHGDKKYEFGKIWTFGYKLEDSDEQILIATTRPETLLGDTAIAVHPEDPRYKPFLGRRVVHPFRKCTIPIIADTMVERDFGTGAVKITPAHDPNDYEVGKRHNLEFINVLRDDGTINEVGGELFQGMKRFDCRIKLIAEMNKLGLYHGDQPNKMRIGRCSRSGDIIEPMLKPQWWVRTEEMAKAAAQSARDGDLKIVPEMHRDTWYRWLDNNRDWCISRQLWWGHRIPAYFISRKGETNISETDMTRWIAAHDDDEARKIGAEKFGCSLDEVIIRQDEDVLDTWFSSGLFPFSVFGWPEDSEELQRFYPITMMETGHDILFFWVARMVMMGMTLTGKLPFNTVFLHAMVRDSHGRKMSKSLGNVIDPVDVIEGISLNQLHTKLFNGNIDPKEIQKAIKGQRADFPAGIAECGTDALRFALCNYTSQGTNVNLDIDRVLGYRMFCNKIWNATKFAILNLGNYHPSASQGLTGHENAAMQWILSRLDATIGEVNKAMKEFDLGAATSAAHRFWLYELCDVYLEVMKPLTASVSIPYFSYEKAVAGLKLPTPNTREEYDQQEAQLQPLRAERDAKIAEEQAKFSPLQCAAQETLYTCLDQGLRLLHPFMPFVTEELWQRLPRRQSETAPSIMVSRFPQQRAELSNPVVEAQMETVNKLIRAARSMRAQYGLVNERVHYYVVARTPQLASDCEPLMEEFTTLAKAESVKIISERAAVGADLDMCGGSVIGPDLEILMLLKGFGDLAQRELKKARTEREKKQKLLDALIKKRSGPGYVKVPPNIQELDQQLLQQYEQELVAFDEMIVRFEKLTA